MPGELPVFSIEDEQTTTSVRQWVKWSPPSRQVWEYVRLQGEYNKMHFPAYMIQVML